jgi:hypothetical protein
VIAIRQVTGIATVLGIGNSRALAIGAAALETPATVARGRARATLPRIAVAVAIVSATAAYPAGAEGATRVPSAEDPAGSVEAALKAVAPVARPV